MPPITLTAVSVSKVLRPPRDYWDRCYKRTGIILKQKDSEVESLERYIRADDGPDNSMTLTTVGDIIPGRHVAEADGEARGGLRVQDGRAPGQGSDITVGDLECPLTDRFKPPYEGMIFSAPTKTVQGL